MVVGPPTIDRNRKRTWWADAYYSRGRTEIGCLVWGALSFAFLVVALFEDFPLWSLGVVLGGPLLLLLLVARMPLADVPIVFVILASLGGIGWEYAATDYPPWTVGLVFVAYVISYEQALAGLAKMRYLESIEGLAFDSKRRQRCEQDHLVAKRRIWGYLLATSSSAVVVSGFDSDGQYHMLLLVLLVLTFLLRSQTFAAILASFDTTHFIGSAIMEGRRWPHIGMALLNAGAYGLSLHWLVVHGSAFGAHIAMPWSGPAGADAGWFGDLETVAMVVLLWGTATLRFEWTS